jgi:hypothetical protein
VAGAPTADEGAAVVAALERFLAESAPQRRQPQASPWQRAALVEGVSAWQAPVPLHHGLDR